MQDRRTRPTSRNRGARFAIAVAAVAMLYAPTLATTAAAADAGAESQFVSAINGVRASRGLAGLSVDGTLTAKARSWAAQMAAGTCGGGICHSNLASGAPSDWQRLGENVGMGPSVSSIHGAFVGSSAHYANMVDAGFNRVGVGVAYSGGTMFVAEEFMQSAGGSVSVARAPRTSAPRIGATPRASAPSRTSVLALVLAAARRQQQTEAWLRASAARARFTHRALCRMREPECVRRTPGP